MLKLYIVFVDHEIILTGLTRRFDDSNHEFCQEEGYMSDHCEVEPSGYRSGVILTEARDVCHANERVITYLTNSRDESL